MTRRLVFLSHTSELRLHPGDLSYVAAAEKAVSSAQDACMDMAYFPARDEKPAQACREKVGESDVYVGIIGFRYGSTVRDEEHLSYTQLEFREATKLGIPRLVFLLSEESQELRLPWSAFRCEHGNRQEEFRKELLRDNGLMLKEISSPQDLREKLLHALLALAPEPVADDTPRTPATLDAQAWRGLEDQLRGTIPPVWAEKAYRWSFGVQGDAAGAAAPFPPPAEDLYDWARDLDAREQAGAAMPKVVAFAHALAAGFRTGGVLQGARRAGALRAWVREVRERFGLGELPRVPNLTAFEVALFVQLDRDPQDPDQVFVDISLYSPSDPSQWKRVHPHEGTSGCLRVPLDSMPDLMEQCLGDLQRHAQALRGEETGYRRPLELKGIEFAVSETLLETDFDQWLCKLGVDEPWKLGARFDVVVSCPEARNNIAHFHDLWWARWEWLNDPDAREDKPAAHWLDAEELGRLSTHRDNWEQWEHHPACVAIAAEEAGPARRAALHLGMPVIVWRRTGHFGARTLPELLTLESTEHVRQLPQSIRTLRRSDGDPGLVLLWDDPNHPLKNMPYSDASFV
ncbi:DUF4062 domain-containing protein [Streptomyces sp. NPDC051913]|uniref:VMAP-C domain-containing protein n=1 Tax=Streptomyces sp. NPDC051913 TaxID=3365676 RepID=UPI0037D42F9D